LWLLIAVLLVAAPARTHAQAALDTIRTRVEAKDFAGALTLVTQLPPELANRPDVRYLTARLYEDQDKYLEALAALPKESTGLPTRVIRDIAERRARWLARTGRCAEARLMLPVLAERDGPDAELTLRAADCAVNQGDAASALALLRNVKGAGSRRFAVRFTLAKLTAQTGDRATAIKDLRALYIEQPEHSRNSEVEDLLRTLVPNLRFTDDERLDRAENYLEAHDHEAALAEIELVKPAKDDKRLKARVLHLRGLELFRTRANYDEASKVLAQAAALGGAPRAEDAYMAAQALARADKDAQAVRAYRAFAQQNPKHPRAREAVHDAAWLELRHDMAGGEAHMKAFLKDAEKRKEREFATSALWELAFYSFTKKHCDKAIPMFEKYAQTSPVAMVKARGLYWAGRCALMAKKRALGIEHLKNALAVEPLHFYSLLSRSRLLSIGVDPGLPFGITAAQATTAAAGAALMEPTRLPDDVQFYLRLGLRSDALSAMQRQEVAIREGMTGDSLVALSTLYQSLGEFTRPYILAERERDNTLKDPPVGTTRPVWDALFPRPYADDVAYAAEEADVPVDLVYAVMRKESAYNPTVVSYANAIGLMQMLERTARDQAEELGWKQFDRPMLFDPSVNVLLGSHFIANLLARYRGQPVPAIAAYNAGEHRVDPWLKRLSKAGGPVELDRWVEDIPIDQTRNYVRRVIGNWARYRYLEHPAEWPVDLPLTLTLKPGARGSG
jgi:soluble lytic murein transglycosylase